MHEIAIASNLYKIVLDELGKNEPITRLKKIKLKIGKLTAVVPEALTFSWAAITNDTQLEGSELEIEDIPILLKCNSCGEEFTIEYPIFICTKCNSTKTQIIKCRELDIVSLIVE